MRLQYEQLSSPFAYSSVLALSRKFWYTLHNKFHRLFPSSFLFVRFPIDESTCTSNMNHSSQHLAIATLTSEYCSSLQLNTHHSGGLSVRQLLSILSPFGHIPVRDHHRTVERVPLPNFSTICHYPIHCPSQCRNKDCRLLCQLFRGAASVAAICTIQCARLYWRRVEILIAGKTGSGLHPSYYTTTSHAASHTLLSSENYLHLAWHDE